MTAELIAQLIVSGLLLGGLYSLMSVGLTLVFGALRIINFAHGELVMLSMYASYWTFQLAGIDPYTSLPLIAAGMFAVGLLVAYLVILPALSGPPVVQIFATVGLTVVFQNLALLLWQSDFRTIKLGHFDHTFVVLGVRLNQPKVLAFLVAAALTGALFLFLQRTFYGKAIRAVSQDRKSARLMGINVDRIYVLTFAIGAACVGVAGGLLVAIYPVFPTVGIQFGIVSFVVVVLGGLGSTTGAAVGGLLIGVIETLSGFFIDPALKQAVYFILFILVLALRPAGLFGVRGSEEFGLK